MRRHEHRPPRAHGLCLSTETHSVRPERTKRGHNHNYGAVAGLVAES